MNVLIKIVLGVSAVVACQSIVLADVYKCVDGSGRITYTNVKGSDRRCELLSADQPVSTVPSDRPRRSASTSSPSDFPRVDSETQRERDGGRRRILMTELATEEDALRKAKEELIAQQEVRYGDERNYQKKLDRLQTYKDRIALHERNIEALQKELSNLK